MCVSLSLSETFLGQGAHDVKGSRKKAVGWAVFSSTFSVGMFSLIFWNFITLKKCEKQNLKALNDCLKLQIVFTDASLTSRKQNVSVLKRGEGLLKLQRVVNKFYWINK